MGEEKKSNPGLSTPKRSRCTDYTTPDVGDGGVIEIGGFSGV